MAITTTVLVTFNNFTDTGAAPLGSLISDANGDLFGTTSQGGAHGAGTVFEIVNTATGYASPPTTLVSFNGGSDGLGPAGSLIKDSNGDLFGTTNQGGSTGRGTVFELAHNSVTGYSSTPTTLANFNGTNGAYPQGSLIADANGDLFGTTNRGGFIGQGTVFELAYSPVTGYSSTPTTIVPFFANRFQSFGYYPSGSLITDASGDLFGTTSDGGYNNGTVFEIGYNPRTGYDTSPTTLVNFGGQAPNLVGSLIMDANGDLFGTTRSGGNGYGSVFEITHDSTTGYSHSSTAIANFNGFNGASPTGSLIADASGNLFGTASQGGSTFDPYQVNGQNRNSGDGTVFEIANTATGYASAPTTLVNFDRTNSKGAAPTGDLLADANGDLFGTTSQGGGYNVGGSNRGTVFEITGSGFVVPCFAAGTRLATPSGSVTVETLTVGDEITTLLSGTARIIWIGSRTVDCARHPQPAKVWPVRVTTNAFGVGLPRRDLFLSPDHAVYVNEVLIPIRCLVNGTTIRRERVSRVTYWHVELNYHDVLLAEGLSAESYLETRGWSNFPNGGIPIALHPDFSARMWESAGCAPLVVVGPELDAVRDLVNRLAAPARLQPTTFGRSKAA